MNQFSLPESKLGSTSLTVSKIGLGTAEIGFAYGIGKRVLPSEKEAIRFLETAADFGITYFDTANIYGLSEERIKKAGISSRHGIIIGTKCGQFLERGIKMSIEEMKKNIKGEVEESLRKLGLDVLPLLYLHGGTVDDIRENKICEIMAELKEDGKARHLGISVRGEEAALAAINSKIFEVIHIAFSILDQRMISKVLFLAEEKGIGVVNRSVLLKGVLTKNYSLLPSSLSILRENAEKAEEIAKSLHLSLPALAIRFVISFKNISTSLIGTNSIEHLKDSLRAVDQGPLSDEVMEELKRLAISDENQVDPARWPII